MYQTYAAFLLLIDNIANTCYKIVQYIITSKKSIYEKQNFPCNMYIYHTCIYNGFKLRFVR